MQSQKQSQIGGDHGPDDRRLRLTEEVGGKTMNTLTQEVAADRTAGEERRRFLLTAIAHDAVDDAVTELLFEHVVLGSYHWTVVASSLAPILSEATGVADESDWIAAADHVLDPDAPPADPAGSRRSEQGTDFTVALIRDFLRALSDDPLVRERIRHRPEIRRRGFDPAYRGGALKEEILGALRSGTAEDWRIVAGQLIAEAREVTGPGAKGGID
jgi:hypothetical protein